MFCQKPIDYEQMVNNRSYVLVTLRQLRVSEAVLREISVWEALKYQNNWQVPKYLIFLLEKHIFSKEKPVLKLLKEKKPKYRLWKIEDE